MIVLDTHAWLWWQSGARALSRRATRAIESADGIRVCSVSVYEVVQLSQRSRIRLAPSVRAWVADALGHESVDELPLTARIALDAAQLQFAGDPFDKIIYATARAADAELVTRDERLRAFDPERTVW